jgi:hypothetical protein
VLAGGDHVRVLAHSARAPSVVGARGSAGGLGSRGLAPASGALVECWCRRARVGCLRMPAAGTEVLAPPSPKVNVDRRRTLAGPPSGGRGPIACCRGGSGSVSVSCFAPMCAGPRGRSSWAAGLPVQDVWLRPCVRHAGVPPCPVGCAQRIGRVEEGTDHCFGGGERREGRRMARGSVLSSRRWRRGPWLVGGFARPTSGSGGIVPASAGGVSAGRSPRGTARFGGTVRGVRCSVLGGDLGPAHGVRCFHDASPLRREALERVAASVRRR